MWTKMWELYDGDWVKDDSHPLYKPGSCGLIDVQFNCFLNGRPDDNYQKLKWKLKGCTLPRYIYICILYIVLLSCELSKFFAMLCMLCDYDVAKKTHWMVTNP
ncbi:hypothetical protein Dimus_029254 [Dionaea muscipula]